MLVFLHEWIESTMSSVHCIVFTNMKLYYTDMSLCFPKFYLFIGMFICYGQCVCVFFFSSSRYLLLCDVKSVNTIISGASPAFRARVCLYSYKIDLNNDENNAWQKKKSKRKLEEEKNFLRPHFNALCKLYKVSIYNKVETKVKIPWIFHDNTVADYDYDCIFGRIAHRYRYERTHVYT